MSRPRGMERHRKHRSEKRAASLMASPPSVSAPVALHLEVRVEGQRSDSGAVCSIM